MVVIPGGEFTMGSSLEERGRSDAEIPHRVRIPRSFAIAPKEVTNEQFKRFLESVPDYATQWKTATTSRFGDPPRYSAYSRTPDSPQVGVSWYDAARYCDWLSEQVGLPKNQWSGLPMFDGGTQNSDGLRTSLVVGVEVREPSC